MRVPGVRLGRAKPRADLQFGPYTSAKGSSLRASTVGAHDYEATFKTKACPGVHRSAPTQQGLQADPLRDDLFPT